MKWPMEQGHTRAARGQRVEEGGKEKGGKILAQFLQTRSGFARTIVLEKQGNWLN